MNNLFPLSIYNVELESFMNLMKGMIGIETELTNFLKILPWNGLINVKFDAKLMEKLADELNFLTNFVNRDNIVNPE